MSKSTPSPEKLEPDAGIGRWARAVPALRWLSRYRPGDAVSDGIAGGVLAVLLLPQALAYALLAELPPTTGLFAALLPAVAYAALGSSRFVSVGPVALVALLTAETVASHADGPQSAPAVALVLAAMVGALLVLGGLLGLARVGDFVSRPMLDGFAAAVAVLIASSQLRHLLGSDTPRASSLVDRLEALASTPIHLPTTVVGATCLVLLLGLPKALEPLLARLGVAATWRPPIVRTVPFVVLAVAILATRRLGLVDRGVEVAGEAKVALPPFTLPTASGQLALDMLPAAITLAVVIFVIGLAVARTLADRDSEIDADREMIALGAANLGASLTGGLPVGASVSRSSVVRDAGASTPLAVPIAGAVALGAAFLAAPLLDALPRAALAALILTAIFGMVDPAAIRRTWRVDRRDGGVLGLTFGGVLLLGVETGLGIGLIASLLVHLWSTARPEVVVVGPADDDEGIRGARRDDVTDGYRTPVLVLRIDCQLYFGNARWVRQQVIDTVLRDHRDSDEPPPRCVLLDMRSVDSIDSTALDMLEGLDQDLTAAGFDIALAESKRPVQAKLQRRLPHLVDQACCFVSLESAIETLYERYESDDPS